MKLMFYVHDPMLAMLRSEEEWKGLFGNDYCDEFPEDFIELEDDAAKEYFALKERFFKISEELRQKKLQKLSM